MATLRTEETEERYREERERTDPNECPLCLAPAKQTFTYWRIVKNKFPYDRFAVEHDMILPLRHVDERGLNENELAELKDIRFNVIHPQYEYIVEATERMKSIPAHYHLHLLVSKTEW